MTLTDLDLLVIFDWSLYEVCLNEVQLWSLAAICLKRKSW